jgi:hypothetical protein
MSAPQPTSVPGRPFQFTFWHVAELMVGLGLAFGLWRELAERSIGLLLLALVAIGFLLLVRRNPAARAANGFSLLACLFLICLILPAFQTARVTTQSGYCQSNLRNIAAALLYYHDRHGQFPPAVIRDSAGRPMHSWRLLIMPQLEYASTIREYNLHEPWDSTDNRMFAARLRTGGYWPWQCPSAMATTKVILPTHYFYVVGRGRTDEHDQLPTIAQIEAADGAANTILLIEVHGLDIDWFEPRDLSIDEALRGINQPGGPGISSPHERESRPSHWYPGAHVVTADGQVHFLPNALDQGTLRALLTIDDGLPIDWSRIRLPDRRPVIIWLVTITIVYFDFLYWRHWPRRAAPSARLPCHPQITS